MRNSRSLVLQACRRAASAARGLAFVLGLATVVGTPSAQAQTFTVLHTFSGADGSDPTGGWISDAKGNLYGTTFDGGDLSCGQGAGCGVVFKLSTTGKETVLYRFTGGVRGENPYGTLPLDVKGNFYGITGQGGDFGYGTVFKVSSKGTETVLHSFGAGADGQVPFNGLVEDAKGNLYGTTLAGGAFGGGGTVFELTPQAGGGWTEKVLHSFSNFTTDGCNPEGGVIVDAEGNLYGATWRGGVSGDFGYGVVFKVSSKGKETVLYTFTGGADGNHPIALTMDAKGNLYGTTYEGGDLFGCSSYGCGVVFKLNTAGKETVLHSFTGGADGAKPGAAPLLDAKGNLYGVAGAGGDLSCKLDSVGCGVVFKLNTAGKEKETVLHTFTGGADGANPSTPLFLDAKGNLYGTTFEGGNSTCPNGYPGCGTVFKVSQQSLK